MPLWKRVARRVSLLLFAALGIANAQIAGDWQGTLHAGDTSVRARLHVAVDSNGKYTATLDSPDQGANGIPADSFTLKGATVNFTSSVFKGSYEGKIGPGGDSIEGIWTQDQPLPLTFTRFTPPKPAPSSDIDGAWQGELNASGPLLRLTLHITNTSAGLTATLDSPDQGAKGLAVTNITRSGSSLVFTMDAIGGRFEGAIKPDLTGIDGTWSQGGNSMALSLKPQKEARP